MDDINPFASPSQPAAVSGEFAGEAWPGLWRDGSQLVMHREARLPAICVKSGVPVEDEGIKRNMTWHPPWIAITILAGLLVYVILALVLTKKARIQIPLSDDQRTVRFNWLIFSWILGLCGVVMILGGLYFALDQQVDGMILGIGIFGGIIVLLAGLITGQAKARILRPTKITDTHLWLKGVHQDIMNRLPPLPE